MLKASVEEFAPAKVNLALHVLGRRADGYHELDSIVVFADVGDTLTFRVAEKTSLEIIGPCAGGVPATADNLVLRAYQLLSEHMALPPVAMSLHKFLPVASGIGGGSADAAATLRGLMKMAGRVIAADRLQKIALALGADVPVCLHGQACRMQGVGEVITPLDRLPAPAIVLVNPQLPCSTAGVFKAMGLVPGSKWNTQLDPVSPSSWRNDMTDAAILVQPAIAGVLQVLVETCPQSARRMSGSGATCFALFDSIAEAEAAAAAIKTLRPQWWVEAATLR